MSAENVLSTTSTHSRFGGLWIDREDASDVLSQKHAEGAISAEVREQVLMFIRDGYVVIRGAVPRAQTSLLREEISSFWEDPPTGSLVENWTPDGEQRFVLPNLSLRNGVTKVLDYHAFSRLARQTIAAPQVVAFLTAIFESRPKAFQTLTFWKGSEQALHKDTAYVQIEGAPMHIAASWLALEDIQPGTGELEFYIGSHRDPEFLFGGEHKWLGEAPHEHELFLKRLQEDAKRYQRTKESFLAREGDVLLWHADLAHGGAAIRTPGATRQSLVTHFTPEDRNPPYMARLKRAAVEEGGCLFISELLPIDDIDCHY